MEITLSPTLLRRALIAAVALVASFGIGAELADHFFHYDDSIDLIAFFGLSYEQNFPTWFSASLLFACSAVLAAIAIGEQQRQGVHVRHWWVLAFTFLYISLDETVEIHELASRWFDFGGVLYFGWVIPATFVVAVFGVSYLNFLRALPARSRNLIVCAGVLYVGGALGVEFILAWWTDRAGDDNFGYAAIDWFEETLEMAGASVFLYALLDALAAPGGRVTIVFRDAAPEPPPG